VYGTISNNIYTISSLIYGTISNNINSVSGLVSGHTTSINTLTTKLTKVFYSSTTNNTFLGDPFLGISGGIDYTSGGLILNNTSPIYQKASPGLYTGNGFFFNSNGGRRLDFVNYAGDSLLSQSLGGFEFWVTTISTVPYVVAQINALGSLSLSGVVAQNNITSPLFTATTKVVTPYVTLNSLYNIGSSQILTAVNNTMTFPLPEIIFCNCASNAINITLPDVSALATTSSCKITIRRILNTLNQVNILCPGTGVNQQRIYSNGNVLSTASNAIGNCTQLLLCGNFWYVNFLT
jgi:hypothetical protein